MNPAARVSAGRNSPPVHSFAVHPDTSELTDLLRRRVSIIADHAWRDLDGAGHLDALKEVSEAISTWTLAHRGALDPQLRHYLANSSLQKALAYVEAHSAPVAEG